MVIAMAHVLEEYTAATEHGWYSKSTGSFLSDVTVLNSCHRQP